jgi:hypothetical protein
MWLKQSSQGVSGNIKSPPRQSELQPIFDAVDHCVLKASVLEDLKNLGVAEEVAKGRRAQVLLTMALGLIRSYGLGCVFAFFLWILSKKKVNRIEDSARSGAETVQGNR